ncbi:uncharacterized protein LOC143296651 [Babylonia areolata]|uniref:uncharacterized protein LOC143296651 n=1 Tax=Babylonia areolata TaxID=304850 RepID=UPI003FD20802
MSGIKLVPEGGGEVIEVPEKSTVIGRGAFLKVTDKRVSRSHALLEVIDGKLHLTPTHTNPCFLRQGSKGQQEVLQRDLRQPLEHGDVFGLLPDQLFYIVTYGDAPVNGVKSNGESKEAVKKEPITQSPAKKEKAKPLRTEPDKEEEEEGDEEPEEKPSWQTRIISVIRADGKNMALPLKKKRTLPAWMIRLSRAGPPSIIKKKPAVQIPRKPPPKPKRRTSDDDFLEDEDEEDRPRSKTRSPRAAAKRRRTFDDDFIDDDEDDEDAPPKRRRRVVSDDDDYEEESEEEPRRRPRGKRSRRRSPSDDDYDSEEERPKKRRKPASSSRQRRRRQRSSDEDDDYEITRRPGKRKGMRNRNQADVDMSGPRPRRAATQKRGSYVDDFMLGDEFDESDEPPAKPDSDSDFQIDGNDDAESGSDVDKRRGSPKKAVSRTPARRGRKRRSRRGSDSEDEDDFQPSDDEYVPRPSRRRGGGGRSKRSRRAVDSEEEEEEEEEEVEAMSRKVKKSPAKSPSKKGKKPCYYGAKCYRRNPDHFKQFSHPNDSDEEEEEKEEEEEEESGNNQEAEAGSEKEAASKESGEEDEK